MSTIINSVYGLISGVSNYIANFFSGDRISQAAKPAIELQSVLDFKGNETAAAHALKQISSAMESQNTLAAIFYAIFGLETPAMRELQMRLAAIKFPQAPEFQMASDPSKEPLKYISEKREYVERLQDELARLQESGLTDSYMDLLNDRLPKSGLARDEYKRIFGHLRDLKSSISHNEVGSVPDEVKKFGNSVQVPAVQSLMITYAQQEKRQDAYELLVSHIEEKELLLESELNEVKEYGKDHVRTKRLVPQALSKAIREAQGERDRAAYENIKALYTFLF